MAEAYKKAPAEISPFLKECFANGLSGNNEGFVASQEQKRESPDLWVIQKNSLVGSYPPVAVSANVLGAIAGDVDLEIGGGDIVEYRVVSGDSLSSIAQKFNISLNTLLWANNLNSNSAIQPSQKLIILPVSGLIHHIQRGDTIGELAETYKTNTDEIIAFNGLSSEGDIFLGDILIIPNGQMPPKSSLRSYASSPVPLASSYFISPISSPWRITQGLHWYNAIDFAQAGICCGNPVYAAAGGEIQKVKLGWNGGYGNYLTIIHPNGVVTLYSHLQSISVKAGEKVSQGQGIGLIGHTGQTIPSGPQGCHLHFEVRGAENPFAK